MRVLWTTNTMPPLAAERLKRGVAGHWMWTLLEILQPNVESITIVTEQEGCESIKLVDGNIQIYVVGVPRPLIKWVPAQRCSAAFLECIRQVKCDIAHVHGTEYPYALSTKLAKPDLPLALSIQGLIGPYSRYMQGALGFWEALRVGGPIASIRGTSPAGVKFAFRLASASERRNIASADVVFCRTTWDVGHVLSIAPGAKIVAGPEAIRPEFADAVWRCRTHSTREPRLLFTNGAAPVKNVVEILAAVAVLVRRGFRPQLRLGGFTSKHDGYVQYLHKKARSLGIEDCLVSLGYLPAVTMIEEMLAADVYISASLIDNSPNSICEAQLLGIPVVASSVGGVIDLVQHNRTGLLYQSGEFQQLAECIVRVVSDPLLAARLSNAARVVARKRHDVGLIQERYLGVYKNLVEGSKTEPSV